MADLFHTADLMRSKELDTFPRTFTATDFEREFGSDILFGDKVIGRYRAPDCDTTVYALVLNVVTWDLRVITEGDANAPVLQLADGEQKSQTLALLKALDQEFGLNTDEVCESAELIRLLRWSADTDLVRRSIRRNRANRLEREIADELAVLQAQPV